MSLVDISSVTFLVVIRLGSVKGVTTTMMPSEIEEFESKLVSSPFVLFNNSTTNRSDVNCFVLFMQMHTVDRLLVTSLFQRKVVKRK